MGSFYQIMEEGGVSEETRKKINDELEKRDEQHWNSERFRDLERRLDSIEKSLTEVRCMVFQTPMEFDSKNKLKVKLGAVAD